MTAIGFPLSTSPGSKRAEGAGRLINCFAQPRGEGEGVVYHRAPGASVFGIGTSYSTFRGGIKVGGTVYLAYDNLVAKMTSAGVISTVDALSGTDKVMFAVNNAATADVVIVNDSGAFTTNGVTVISYSDPDVGSPNSVCCHTGYFIFGYGNGDIQASDLNSTNINTLNRARTESNPDGVVRPISYNGNLYVYGSATVEVWGDPVNPSGFPFNRVGYNFTPGLIGDFAISGWEPEFGNAPIWVGSDNTVRQLSGYSGEKISPPDLDRLIAAVSDKTTLEARCYVVDGFAFWELSCDDWTWVYNCNNQKWHERKSYLLVRSRFTGSVFAFDKWLAGDTQSGDIFAISTAVVEGTNPVVFTAESGAVKSFPNRIRVRRADFDFSVGVGNAQGLTATETDPQVGISWSDDGGNIWSTPRLRNLGTEANFQQRVTVVNTGMSGPMGRRWRVAISDPVHVGLLGGDMAAQIRKK